MCLQCTLLSSLASQTSRPQSKLLCISRILGPKLYPLRGWLSQSSEMQTQNRLLRLKPIFNIVLVVLLYCHVMLFHEFCDGKGHTFIILHLLRSRSSGSTELNPLLMVSQGYNQGFVRAMLPFDTEAFPPGSFRLLVEFISLWLWHWWLASSTSARKPLTWGKSPVPSLRAFIRLSWAYLK